MNFIDNKLIIFLGLNNTGKDYNISNLIEYIKNNYKYNNINLVKFNNDIPIDLNLIHQKIDVNNKFKNSLNLLNDTNNGENGNIIIWNRSHLDEYVYGQLYRNRYVDWIFDLEEKYNIDKYNNIYLIFLYANENFISNKILYNKINNNSFYNNKNYIEIIELIKNELIYFNEIYEKTKIKNKIKINVKKIDKSLDFCTNLYNYEYKDKDEILKIITKFLNI